MEVRRFNWMSLLTGILFLILSFCVLINPNLSLQALVVYIAVVAIIEGGIELFFRHKIHQIFDIDNRRWVSLLVGVVLIVLGILLLCNLSFGMHILPYIFAVWFVIDSLENVFLLDFAKMVGRGYYWFTIIASIIGIVLGVYLFFNPAVSSLVLCYCLCFFFMWFGIQYIWEAFVLKF